MWRIWWAPNNASKWQKRFNSAFKGLTTDQGGETSLKNEDLVYTAVEAWNNASYPFDYTSLYFNC